jgi:hypothetical protein
LHTPLLDASEYIRYIPPDWREHDDSRHLVEDRIKIAGQTGARLMSAREGAVRHFEEELARYESPREWWRIATLPDGEPIGFVIPGTNSYGVIIGYLGVVPSHRGNGYIDEILAEGTRILAAQGAPRIRASPDLANMTWK